MIATILDIWRDGWWVSLAVSREQALVVATGEPWAGELSTEETAKLESLLAHGERLAADDAANRAPVALGR